MKKKSRAFFIFQDEQLLMTPQMLQIQLQIDHFWLLYFSIILTFSLPSLPLLPWKTLKATVFVADQRQFKNVFSPK